MLKISGVLINIIPQGEYTSKEGLTTSTKAKLQILVESIRANGTKVKELHTISIPDSKISIYKDLVSKQVDVDVGIISQNYSFYGI